MTQGPLSRLYQRLTNGEISRRDFIASATATGVGAGCALFMANTAAIAAAGGSKNGFAFYPGQDGTPAASPTGAGKAPDTGTEGQTRGEGGELKIIQWQAATLANAQVATGTKDVLIAAMVQEPLMHYLPDGTIIPNLITEVPSVENGLLAEDLTTVTFKVVDGIVWSDGTPFTSRDIQFTWQWITDPENSAVNISTWQVIKAIETPDPLTAVVTYAAPSASWFEPWVGSQIGPLLPAHAFNDIPKSSENPGFLSNPIGTGPFVITEFVTNDRVALTANANYREANKPYFATVAVKGGGDAASAARAVLQTGDYHYAWNLQVEPAVLLDLAGISAYGEVNAESAGALVSEPGTNVERININFSDPNTEVDGQRSEINTPHPFLTDLAVRQAMNKAVARQLITDEFYGLASRTTANMLTGLASFESPNTSWEFNIDAANKILDDAGWVLNGDTREKDGIKLEVTYGTTINPVRQKTQAVVKQGFEKIGIKVALDQVDSGIFFDSAAGNDRNTGHMYWDINMYTSSPSSPVPTAFLDTWRAGADNANVAQKSNGWSTPNVQRYVNPEYDAAYDRLVASTNVEEASAIMIEMNDILINDVVVIPQVNRPADTYAISQLLIGENVAQGVGYEVGYWNVANWRFV